MHKRAYSNDNTLFVSPALKCTEVNQNQFSLIQLEKWFSFDSVKDTTTGCHHPPTETPSGYSKKIQNLYITQICGQQGGNQSHLMERIGEFASASNINPRPF